MGLRNIDRAKLIREVAEELDLPYSKTRGVIDEVFHMTLDFLERPYEHDKVAVFLMNFGMFEPIQRRVMAKAFKAEENKDEWNKFSESVVNYYDRKKNSKHSEKKKERVNSPEQRDNREE